MNDVPPGQTPSDDIDSFYRRASALDPSRPSDRTRQAVLAHAKKLAGSNTGVNTKLRRERWWRPAVFGTLAAAGLAALLVLPQILTPHLASRTTHSTARLSEPGTNAPATVAAQRKAASDLSAVSPIAALAPTESGPAADSAGANEALKAQAGSPQALRLAAETGDLKRLQLFLDQQTDVNSRDDAGRTALLLATLHGQTKAIKMLLAHGADPNAADASGVTPLSAATAANRSAIVRILKDAGAR